MFLIILGIIIISVLRKVVQNSSSVNANILALDAVVIKSMECVKNDIMHYYFASTQIVVCRKHKNTVMQLKLTFTLQNTYPVDTLGISSAHRDQRWLKINRLSCKLIAEFSSAYLIQSWGSSLNAFQISTLTTSQIVSS
ncbi:Hypothetical_protein [Hexamita inflata]|uniref:Hypothetical_protein n=1 Tax=Hexamita inflata TaxID=28002 RepID=A0AA86RMZ3_9EUKA|nr:Hypothetical protein HINF_LOCUS57040 [Hexamita inflata]